MSSIAITWRELFTQVREHRGQLGLSLRVTIAAVLSFAFSLLLHVPLPLWTVLTAVILTQVSFGSSVRATVNYLIGTLSGAVYAGALGALVPHSNEIALAAVLAIAVAPLALLAAISQSFSAATFTGVLVILIPGVTHVGPIESAFYRVIEVLLGGLTALAVSLVLPTRAHALAVDAAAQMLDLMARCLPQLFSGLMERHDAAEIVRLQDSIGQAFARSDAIAAEARHERIGLYATEPSLGPLMRTLLRLRHDLVMIGRAAAEPLPETFRARFGAALAQVTETTAGYLRRSGEALDNRRKPPPRDAAEAALDGFAVAVADARREGLTRGLSVETVEHVFALAFALEQMRRNLADLERCVRDAARWR